MALRQNQRGFRLFACAQDSYRNGRDSTSSTCLVQASSMLGTMTGVVAAGAKCYQIPLLVWSGMAPKFDVMNLKIQHVSASLASPVVSLEYLPMQSRVVLRGQF